MRGPPVHKVSQKFQTITNFNWQHCTFDWHLLCAVSSTQIVIKFVQTSENPPINVPFS